MNISEKLLRQKQDFDAVYSAGKKAGNDAFWDAYQENGKRNEYYYAFSGKGWDDELFKPKYDIIASYSGTYMFTYSCITDLTDALNKAGITLDTSSCTSLDSLFSTAKVTRVPEISAVSASRLYWTFNNAKDLIEIPKFIIKADGSQVITRVFDNCIALEKLIIDGTIGQNGFNVQWSTLLSHDSLMSILNALKDYSADTSGTEWVVTIGSENVAKLTTDELDIAHNKGWQVV